MKIVINTNSMRKEISAIKSGLGATPSIDEYNRAKMRVEKTIEDAKEHVRTINGIDGKEKTLAMQKILEVQRYATQERLYSPRETGGGSC